MNSHHFNMNGKPHGHPIHCGNSAFSTRTVHLSNKGLSDPHVQDSASSGTEKCGQDFHAEERSMSVDWGPKIPHARVHYVATIVRSQELSPLAPDGPSTLSLRPDRLYRLWVTPRWTTGRNTNTIKPAIACGAWFSWCPRQDSNLRRPGLEGPHSSVYEVAPMS